MIHDASGYAAFDIANMLLPRLAMPAIESAMPLLEMSFSMPPGAMPRHITPLLRVAVAAADFRYATPALAPRRHADMLCHCHAIADAADVFRYAIRRAAITIYGDADAASRRR